MHQLSPVNGITLTQTSSPHTHPQVLPESNWSVKVLPSTKQTCFGCHHTYASVVRERTCQWNFHFWNWCIEILWSAGVAPTWWTSPYLKTVSGVFLDTLGFLFFQVNFVWGKEVTERRKEGENNKKIHDTSMSTCIWHTGYTPPHVHTHASHDHMDTSLSVSCTSDQISDLLLCDHQDQSRVLLFFLSVVKHPQFWRLVSHHTDTHLYVFSLPARYSRFDS